MNYFPGNVKLLSTQRFFDGGKSSGNFENFNLALHVNDNKDRVLQNRKLLNFHYDLPSEPIWINQTHSSICIDAASINTTVEADASYSSKVGIVCAIMTADCLPVFVSKKDGTMVGIAHAGWRGLASWILPAVIASMGVDPKTLMAWLGPAISQAAYEVGNEVREAFVNSDPDAAVCFAENKSGRWQADLYGLAKRSLQDAGLLIRFAS